MTPTPVVLKMTGRQQFILAVIVAIGGIIVPIGTAYVNGLQAKAKATSALSNYDEARSRGRSHRHPPTSVPAEELGRRTDMGALADSALAAAQAGADRRVDDTAKVLVQPTGIGRMLGQRARYVPVRALRPRTKR